MPVSSIQFYMYLCLNILKQMFNNKSKMKKIFVTLAILASAVLSANAQIRVEIGANLGSYRFDDYKMDSKFAPKAAVYYNFLNDNDGNGLEVGLALTQYKIENSATKGTMTISNIQVPVRGTYCFNFNDNFALMGGVGLYAGYAADGKTVLPGSITNDPFEGEGGMKKFDFGSDDTLLLKIMDKFCIGLGYQYSFLNLCKSKDVKVEGSAFSFNLGYIF